jgi:glutamine synthetase
VCGPELEFYLCEPDASAPGGYRRYGRHDSPVYTVGFVADRQGVLDRMLESCVTMGLGAFAANHEYGRGQYEINIGHAPALVSADRAFQFKTLVKELAARDGLLATFMGKPWNDDEGSGFHLHISLATRDSANAFDEPGGPDGLSPLVRHFTAGVLAHASALMAFLNPTVNAYRRIAAQGLVPTRANWGHDNRFTLVRIPKERGKATRLEVRVGDGTANPYLAYAAVFLAGLDGIARELEPPAPLAGNIYLLPEEEQGDPLPINLETALEALANDAVLSEGMGEVLVSTYTMMKNAELDRYRKWVSDWEFTEYSHHL